MTTTLKKSHAALQSMKLVGMTMRTNNQDEMNPKTRRIGPTVEKYFTSNISSTIAHRKAPGVTYCIYTEFEEEDKGEYTYFIGEEVENYDNIPEGLHSLDIAASDYMKFTAGPGPMPQVCIDAWQSIWCMKPSEFEGKRKFVAEIEVYDERARNPQNTSLDIYIGIKK